MASGASKWPALLRVSASKRLGQNFLPSTSPAAQKVARAAARAAPGGAAVEIGPGPGGLTRALLEHVSLGVLAIEKDPRMDRSLRLLAAAAREDAARRGLAGGVDGERLVAVHGDVLDVDWGGVDGLLERHWPGAQSTVLVGNLPFNISTTLLLLLLSHMASGDGLWRARPRTEMILMFQREVAQMLVAKPSTAHRGRLSVLVERYCAHASLLFTVPSHAFTPAPKVDGAVVHFVPPEAPVHAPARASLPFADVSFSELEDLLRALFHHRRKTSQTTLGLKIGPARARAVLAAAGVSGAARPQDLLLDEWLAICTAMRSV